MDEQTNIHAIYVGPTIAKLGLIRNQVFLDGLPGHITALQEEYPELDELIVPVEGCSSALDAAKTKGTHIHHAAQKLREKAGVR